MKKVIFIEPIVLELHDFLIDDEGLGRLSAAVFNQAVQDEVGALRRSINVWIHAFQISKKITKKDKAILYIDRGVHAWVASKNFMFFPLKVGLVEKGNVLREAFWKRCGSEFVYQFWKNLFIRYNDEAYQTYRERNRILDRYICEAVGLSEIERSAMRDAAEIYIKKFSEKIKGGVK